VEIDALDFGAATKRERVVIIGYNKDHIGKITVEDLMSAKKSKKYSVRDAIADLQAPQDSDWHKYKKKLSEDLSSYAKRARSVPASDLGTAECRLRLKRNEVSGVLRTAHTHKTKVASTRGRNCCRRTKFIEHRKHIGWVGTFRRKWLVKSCERSQVLFRRSHLSFSCPRFLWPRHRWPRLARNLAARLEKGLHLYSV
jgi:DNA (cytosine-5)-methyltransferase 1